MKKWIVLAALLSVSSVGFVFLWNFERVVLEWSPGSEADVDHYVVYYGPESRNPWWREYEEYFYAIEESALFPKKIASVMKETPRDNPYYPELERLLREAEETRDALARFRKKAEPYPNKAVIPARRTNLTLWIPRGSPCFAAIRAFDSSGNGSRISDELRYVGREKKIRKDQGNNLI